MGSRKSLPLAERKSQSGKIIYNRGEREWMDESHISKVRVCARSHARPCVCVKCKCLYIAVGNTCRQSGRLKLAVWATCLPLTKPETEKWREQEGRRGWRKRRGWGRGRETLIRLLVLLVALSLPSTTPFLPRCNTGTHCWTVWIGGAGGLVFQAKQSSHTSSPDRGQISQRI